MVAEASPRASSRRRRPSQIERRGGSLLDRYLPALFQPIDNASLVFFRLILGGTTFFHLWKLIDEERVRRAWVEPDFHFSYYGLSWLKALPGDMMLLLFFLMSAAAVLVLLGLFYRQAIIFLFVAHTYVILIDQATFWNHYYLLSLFAFMMIFVPANRAYSLDVAWRKLAPSDTAPAWSLYILRAQMGLTYFFAGIAKINGDWLNGVPMDSYLLGETSFPFLSSFFDDHWLAMVFSYGGLLFDLTITFFMLWPRTRIPAVGAAVIFHILNSLLFDIEVFPWFAIAATLLFLPPDWPRLGGQLGRSGSATDAAEPPRYWWQLTTAQKAGAAVLGVYFFIQVVLPLRHFAYPGNVDWTAEGDLFAWRMLIAQKDGEGTFWIRDQTTGQDCSVRMSDYVEPFQVAKLTQRPDMMVQFAHLLKDEFAREGREIEVYVRSSVKINGRSERPIVDPEVDLAAEKRRLHQPWVLPMEGPRTFQDLARLTPCRDA